MDGTIKIILALTSSALLAGCTAQSQTRMPDKQNVPGADPIAVHAIAVQPVTNAAAGDLLIPAALSVDDTAVVLAEREGRIVNLPVQEGATVEQGATLAQFNEDDERAQLHEAELEVSRLKVEEQQYEASIKLNKAELDRAQLLASQGLISKSEVEQAQFKLEQSIHEA